MATKPCKLQDPNKVKLDIDRYFQDRLDSQEVRELKNGDKKVYRKPPSIFGLCEYLGISEDTFANYTNPEARNPETINHEIVGLLKHAKKKIIEELYEGVSLGYWTEKIVLAQLTKFGVIGEDTDTTVKVVIQGSPDWSK